MDEQVRGRETRNNVWAIHFNRACPGWIFYPTAFTAVVILDITRRREVRRIEMGSYIHDISVSDDGRLLFVACYDFTGRVVSVQPSDTPPVILTGHTDHIHCIIPCEDTDVLTCSDDKTIRRWNHATGESMMVYIGHSDKVRSVLYDRRMKRIFSASMDMTIIVWNADAGEQIGVMTGHSRSVNSIAWVNPTTIVSGSDDTTLKIWDTTELKEVKTMSSHESSVLSVAATPDGKNVISGSYDNTVKVWSVATGECLTTLTHHHDIVSKVAVSPDGQMIASGGFDKTLNLIGVVPPFKGFIYDGLLTGSEYRLLSDGTLLCSGEVCFVLSASTICTTDSETQFTLRDMGFSAKTLTAPSASAAQGWIEIIHALKRNLSIEPSFRSHSLQAILSRYRFDFFQASNFHFRRNSLLVTKDTSSSQQLTWFPKDVLKVIRIYITVK